MRKTVRAVALATLFCLAIPATFAKTPAAPPRSGQGMIVIVFKDGHRQSFNLADVARVEFPVTAAEAADVTANGVTPPRHFLGKWEVGDGTGNNFYITLQENGDAMRSIGNVHGKWVYVNGEAHITWDDGAEDVIRKAGSHYEKCAYNSGKFFTGTPENVTPAHNTTPHPI
jgi:hypothetical protein